MQRSGKKWLVFAFVLVSGLLALYAYQRDLPGKYLSFQKSQSEVDALRSEKERLEEHSRLLQERVEQLNSDPVEIEAAIRRNRGLVREGEKVFQIELPEELSPEAGLE